MSFTTSDVIADARRLVQDTVPTYRYDDPFVLAMVNQTLRRMALLRPDLVGYVGTITCVQGSLQTAPADSIRIIDLLQVVGANNLNEINRESVDLMFSTWQIMTPGVPVNWMRHVRSPNRFLVYPPAIAGTQLVAEYAQSPKNYAIGETIALIPDAYFPCVVDGTIWMLESTDAEHVASGRAEKLQAQFMQLLGMTVQNKPVTDTEEGGEPPEGVY
jgi:hypothetical protein